MKPLDYRMPTTGAAPTAGAFSRYGVKEGVPGEIPLLQMRNWLLQHGEQSSAYFNLQAGVQYFLAEGKGFISYFPQPTPFGRVNIVYTNPVCHGDDLPELLREFLQFQQCRTLFIGVDERVAKALGRFGFRPNQMGREFSLKLDSFDLAGKHKKQLRHAANLGERHQIEVREQGWQSVDQQAVLALSRAWRRGKAVHGRELRLLTRPPVFADEWKVRKFFAYRNERLLGYVFFDPYFQHGRVSGYCANILRSWPGVRPSGVLDYILLQAMERFREEGIRRLSLGIAPLHGVDACPHDKPSVRRIQQWLYQHANSLYAFQALAYHKSRYRADETPWYLCSDDIGLLKMSWALLGGTRLLGR